MQYTDKERLSAFIMKEVLNQNELAWELLAETGDDKYNWETMNKAADIILNLEDNG
jgi:hypothetical protein